MVKKVWDIMGRKSEKHSEILKLSKTYTYANFVFNEIVIIKIY